MNNKRNREKRNSILMKMDELIQPEVIKAIGIDNVEKEFNQLKNEVETLDNEIRNNKVMIKEEGYNMKYNEEVRSFLKGEVREMNTTAGGNVIPMYLEKEIIKKVTEDGTVVGKAKVFNSISGDLEVVKETENGDAVILGEDETLTPDDFTNEKVKLSGQRVATGVQLTKKLINDAGIDVVNYVSELCARRINKALSTAIVNGNKNFEGLVTKNVIEGTLNADTIIDLVYDLPQVYYTGGVILMNRNTFKQVAKMKDGDNTYLVTKDYSNGIAYRLLGLEVQIIDSMQDNILCVANIENAYALLIKKNMELNVIGNDTTQALAGKVLTVLDMYADGKVVNEDAVRTLKATTLKTRRVA